MTDSTDNETFPPEPGSVPDASMEFEAADDAPPDDGDPPENDQELGDAEEQEDDGEVDDGEA